MAREHTDVIDAAKGAPDIETALETVFSIFAQRWSDTATRNDYGKGQAMGRQLTEDVPALVDAILNHDRVFKAPEGPKTKPRGERLTAAPKTVVRPMTEDEWDALTPEEQERRKAEKPVEASSKPVPNDPAYASPTAAPHPFS